MVYMQILCQILEDKNVQVRNSSDASGSLAYIYYVADREPTNGQLVVLYDVDRKNDGGEIQVCVRITIMVHRVSREF